MAVISFATLGIPIWRRRALPNRQIYFGTWLSIAVAVICAVVAPFMYIKLPTEWSQFMVIAAGIIQAFMTLELALLADGAGATKGDKQD